jgi:hypothetical protein
MGTGALALGVKTQGREADHSPSSTVKVKNGGTIPPLLHTPSRGAELVKPKDNFLFYVLGRVYLHFFSFCGGGGLFLYIIIRPYVDALG